MLNDETIDNRIIKVGTNSITIKQFVKTFGAATPKEDTFRYCAQFLEYPSIRGAEAQAIWFDLENKLAQTGLSKREILQVLIRALHGAFAYQVPVSSEVVYTYCKSIGDIELAKELCTDGITNQNARSYAYGGLVVLAHADQIDTRFDSLIDFNIPVRDLRIILDKLPVNRKEEFWSKIIDNAGEPFKPLAARRFLERIVQLVDLIQFATVWEKITALAAYVTENKDKCIVPAALSKESKEEEINKINALLDQLETKKLVITPIGEDGLTKEARDVLARCLENVKQHQRVAAINEIAKKAHIHNFEIEASELRTIETWKAASPARRKAIVSHIEELTGIFKFVEIKEGDIPLAIYKHKASKQLFSLVPGGTYDRGLSQREEDFLKQHAAESAKKGKPLSEEDTEIFNHLNIMRPLTITTVGPLLACQNPCITGTPLEIVNWLDSSPFRLLSEAEWEWLARGGKQHELTWKGNLIPTQKWMNDINNGRTKSANAFGLWGFGYLPELCADVWHPSNSGVSPNAEPRWGEGPRVARGGAGRLTPWQACGEWQLLCTAMRQEAGNDFMAVRPVIGLPIKP